MNNPSLFIGRNLRESSRQWLGQNQIRFVEQPMIEVSYVEPEALGKLFLEGKTQWVLTSCHAASWLVKFGNQIGFKKNDPVFCLSVRQAAIIKIYTNNIFISELANAHSLVELLLKTNQTETIVYLRGDKSLDTISEAVLQSEKILVEIEVYKNEAIKTYIKEEFEAYLFFSPSGIESFIDSENIVPLLAQVVTIGETTGKFASESFQNEVFISPEQDELSMIKYALKKL